MVAISVPLTEYLTPPAVDEIHSSPEALRNFGRRSSRFLDHSNGIPLELRIVCSAIPAYPLLLFARQQSGLTTCWQLCSRSITYLTGCKHREDDHYKILIERDPAKRWHLQICKGEMCWYVYIMVVSVLVTYIFWKNIYFVYRVMYCIEWVFVWIIRRFFLMSTDDFLFPSV